MSTPSKQSKQIDSLTPLRGIAAVLVVFYHMNSLLGFQKLGPILDCSSFLARGYLWVDFFFVLSGFIITHVYGGRFTQEIRAAKVREYIAARFARIYPLHLFALCLSIVLYLAVYSRMPAPGGGGGNSMMKMLYDWKALPFHFMLLISFGLTRMTWNVPAWSIGAEWWTYLLALPLFRVLNRGVSARTFLTAAACSAGLYVLVTRSASHTLDITFDFGLVRCLLDFTVGICAYQVYRSKQATRLFVTDTALAVSALITFAVLHFPLVGAYMPEMGHPFPDLGPLIPMLDAVSPIAFALLIVCAALNTTKGHRALNVKPLKYLGDISYSVYMMQGTIFFVFFAGCGIYRHSHPVGRMEPLPLVGLLALTLGVDLLIASATYRWIEVPARAWLRKRSIPVDRAHAIVTERHVAVTEEVNP